MNDRIKVNSASLSEWADQAEGIAAIVRDAQDLLKNVDMSPRWWDSVGTIGPLSLKLAAQSVQLGFARAAIRGMELALSASADATDRFAGQIRQADRNFTDAAAMVDGRIDALLTGKGIDPGKFVVMPDPNWDDSSLRVDNPTNQDKDKLIDNYEKNHILHKLILEDFLNSDGAKGLTEDDIRNIKYLVYTADEPYRSLYLNSLLKFRIRTINGSGGYYMPWSQGIEQTGEEGHTVTYTYPDCFADDPRGPYTVFFHECGHAIDDLNDKSQQMGYDTTSFTAYSDEIGRDVTLREAIDYDVYYNTNNPHSVTSIAQAYFESKWFRSQENEPTEISHVIAAFQNGNTNGLTNSEVRLFNHVVNQFNRTTGRDGKYESVTDVYGGVTHNLLRNNGYGHGEADYWSRRDSDAPARELWAEFFSYNMARNTENLAHLEEYFPEAAKVMKEYAAR